VSEVLFTQTTRGHGSDVWQSLLTFGFLKFVCECKLLAPNSDIQKHVQEQEFYSALTSLTLSLSKPDDGSSEFYPSCSEENSKALTALFRPLEHAPKGLGMGE
jgi:hypothetical protein